MIKAILFDIDGTLIDSFHRNLDFYKHIFTQAGVGSDFLTEEVFRPNFHLPLQDCLLALSPVKTKSELSKLMNVYHNLDWQPEDFLLFPNAMQTVAELSKNYKLGIVTGRQQLSTSEFLSETGLDKYFNAVVHHGIYEYSKPHPQPITICLAQLEVSPEEAVYIGDAQVDIDAAHAAGCKAILYKYITTGELNIENWDFAISDYNELPQIVNSL